MATCYKSPLANPHSTLLLQCLTSRQPSELPPSLPDLLPRRRSHRYLRSGSARTSQLSTTTKTRGKTPQKIADARPGKSCVTNPSINGLCPTVWCSHTVRRLPPNGLAGCQAPCLCAIAHDLVATAGRSGEALAAGENCHCRMWKMAACIAFVGKYMPMCVWSTEYMP